MRSVLPFVVGMLSFALTAPARPVALPTIEWRRLTTAGGAGLVGWVALGSVGLFDGLARLTLAGLVGLIPGALRRHRTAQMQVARAVRWPDFLAAVRSRLAGGSPLPEACRRAGRHIGGEFAELDTPTGLPFSETLERARVAFADPLADRVLTTVSVAHATGGAHVGAVLADLTASVADEVALRRSHAAAMTQQRVTAGVALLAPWVILGLSIATNPGSAEAFATATGTTIVVGGALATITGYLLARRAAALSQPPRLFT